LLAGKTKNRLKVMDTADIPRRVLLALRDLGARVRSEFGPRVLEVRLYGSFARGQGRPESDVDIFIRLEDLSEAERRRLFEMAAETSIDHFVTVQVFAPSAEEYRWLERNECRILRDVRDEGVAA
jgi:uncharacterized protein